MYFCQNPFFFDLIHSCYHVELAHFDVALCLSIHQDPVPFDEQGLRPLIRLY
nr:MAG TPA: hypothetical protein [Caudoviricetes sp.]